jgi:peptidoglycan/LPS O-acetylase OafA/YrhL
LGHVTHDDERHLALQIEWVFCLSLLVLAIPARWRWSGLLVPPGLLGLVILHEALAPRPTRLWLCAAMLLAGMSIAGFRTLVPNLRLTRWQASLGTAFLLLVLGADPFGLFSSGPARRLGNISYGIYLLQGPVFAVAFANHRIRGIELGSPLGHFAVSTAGAIMLVILATFAHRVIEKPGVEFGRQLLLRESAIKDSVPFGVRPTLASTAAGD